MTRDSIVLHSKRLAKATVSSVPVVGGPLASLLGDYLPDINYKRVCSFLKELDRRVQDVECVLDDDKFGFLVQKALRVAASDHREFKRNLLASIVAGAAAAGADSVSVARLFIDATDALEPHHASILRRLKALGPDDEYHEKVDLSFVRFSSLTQVVRNTPAEGPRPDDPESITVQGLSQLISFGLITSTGSLAHARLPMSCRSASPVSMWRMGVYRLSPLGERYVAYLAEVETE